MKIKNNKFKCNNKDINEEEYLNIILNNLKSYLSFINIAKTESSNNLVYELYDNIYSKISILQRKTYDLSFKLGFYTLEKVSNTTITNLYDELNNKYSQIK